MSNTIPPITDPLGKHWDAPPASEIAIDNTHAMMNRYAFDQLHNYEISMPSGVYPGKMWRRGDFLVWFAESDIEGYCSLHSREICVVD